MYALVERDEAVVEVMPRMPRVVGAGHPVAVVDG